MSTPPKIDPERFKVVSDDELSRRELSEARFKKFTVRKIFDSVLF